MIQRKVNELLRLEKLSTGYQKASKTREVSKKISGSLYTGGIAALIGPNGSGKTTLLRSIAGLQPILDGKVLISGYSLNDLSAKERAKHMSLVLTDRPDNQLMRVSEVVSIGRYPYLSFRGKLRSSDRRIIHEAMAACRLEGFEHRYFVELSDGEKQRCMIARALVQETEIILLDEPTAHLDLPNRVDLMRMLSILSHATNRAILISTHELNLALRWCDYIWLLDREGQLTISTPEDLVLSGKLSEVFGNDEFHFDPLQGDFLLKRPAQRKLQVVVSTDDEVRRIWTLKALERVGITASDETCRVKLNIEDSFWTLNTSDSKQSIHCKSIEEVLQELLGRDRLKGGIKKNSTY